MKQKMCFVTFDQPLYYKAKMIIFRNDRLKNIKVGLGDFYFLMSYLGVGYIMNGKGLEKLWDTP